MRHWLLLFHLLPLFLSAQPPEVRRFLPLVQQYSVEQGLSNRFVRDVFQDSRGFIWLSTHFGINRFDGHAFTAYTAQSHGLRSNTISAVREDPDGWLWVFQYQDSRVQYLQLLDPRTGRVENFEEHFPGRKLPFALGRLAEHRGVQGLRFLLTTDGSWYRYLGRGRFAHRALGWVPHALYPTRRGAVEAIRFNAGPGQNRRAELDSAGGARTLPFRDSTATVLSTWNAQPSQPLWEAFPPNPSPEARRLRDPHRGRVWHLDPKLLRLEVRSPEGTLLHDFSPRLTAASGFQTPYCAMLDRSGSLWVSGNDGVLVFDLTPNRFRNLLTQPAGSTEAWVSTRGLHRSGDTLWANSMNGLWRVALSSGQVSQYAFFRPETRRLDYYQYAHLLDRRGTRWLGSQDLVGLPGPGQPERVIRHPTKNAWAFFEDGPGTLWLGGEIGLGRVDPRDGRNLGFAGYGPYAELAQAKITAFQPDPDGTLWVCASSGLYVLDRRRQRVTARYHVGGDAAHRLPFNFISFILPDQHEPGVYWLATRGAGLLRWHRPTGQTQVFAHTEGLSNEVLHAVYDDDRGGLWLPSDRGLMRFDKQSHTVRAFFEKDGIAHDEFNLTSHHRDADGRLYFGGLNGVTTFHPADFYEKKGEAPPRLAVASLRRQDARTGLFSDQSASFWHDGGVQLSPGERAAELTVCLPDFRQPAYHTFAYRLRGLQESWVYQPGNVVTLSGLPAGRYTLEIRAQNSVGEWTPALLHIPVRMLPPVYLRWWFLLGVAATLLGSGISIFWLRTRALRQENERLETEVATRTAKIQQQADALQELDRLKSRFFANVSHELRTPLTLMLGSLNLIRRASSPEATQRPLDVAERNAAALLRQVNQLLDLNRLEAQRLERHDRPVRLRPFLARVVEQFESQAEHLGQRLAFDDQTPDDLTLRLDGEKLETILVNLLSNALKYTPPGGRIALHAEEADGWLRLTVSDTGRGIHPDDLPRVFDRFFQTTQPDAPAEGGSGIGLSLVKELTEFLGGTVAVQSRLGEGSAFGIRLPVVPTTPEGAAEPFASPSSPAASPPPPSPARPTHPTARILLVEDHPDMRAYLTELLAPEFDVEALPDGARAFERLRTGQNPPDLVLSDRMMPGLDGLQLLEKLRATEDLPLTPFVLLTARAGETDRLEALRVGVDDYLTKPFNPDELLARVRNLVGNARRRRAFLAETGETATPLSPDELIAQDWLKTVEREAQARVADPHFGVGDLAEVLALSERQLTRRLRSLTGLSPNQYLQEVRLQAARAYFEAYPHGGWKLASAAVGFTRPDYLRRLYGERFGTDVPETA